MSLSALIGAAAQRGLVDRLAANKSLYEAVALLPSVVDQKVAPRKWIANGATDSYYIVKRAHLTHDNTRGVVKGVKVWNGKVQDEGRARTIRGGLKHYWEPLGHVSDAV